MAIHRAWVSVGASPVDFREIHPTRFPQQLRQSRVCRKEKKIEKVKEQEKIAEKEVKKLAGTFHEENSWTICERSFCARARARQRKVAQKSVSGFLDRKILSVIATEDISQMSRKRDENIVTVQYLRFYGAGNLDVGDPSRREALRALECGKDVHKKKIPRQISRRYIASL